MSIFWGLFLTINIYGQGAKPKIEAVKTAFRFEIQSIPAWGFFPLGGDSLSNDTNLGTFITGTSLDVFGFDFLKKLSFTKIEIENGRYVQNRYTYTNEADDFGERISLLNVSAYLIGLNFNSLKPESKGQFFNVAYIRVGPRFRHKGYGKHGSMSIGGQFGYGFLLNGDISAASSTFQHGIDISFTFTWTPFTSFEIY